MSHVLSKTLKVILVVAVLAAIVTFMHYTNKGCTPLDGTSICVQDIQK